MWETGGFHVHIRKPLRDVEPRKAQKYLQDLLPGICGLAERAAQADGVSAAVRWEHEHGRVVLQYDVHLIRFGLVSVHEQSDLQRGGLVWRSDVL